ncbi:MAG: TetR family transcriptional regulator [Oscillospiraceae bacterium]|nr:TetR family transcriptional regulator [Oscillospiraceae bacterium]MBQ7129597.1 TetR family transcriptional regulator [Oscillospiraceae bacterium]
MGKQFKTERAAQQQAHICQALVALMEKQSYGEISVSGICVQADIPRRTFYYYFDSKEDVLSFLLDGVLKECALESMLRTSRPEELAPSLTRFFRYWRDCRRRELTVLMRSGLEQELIMRCLRWVSSEQQWTQLVADYTEEERSVSMLLGITSVFYTLLHWCAREFRQSPEYMAACVARILTTPLVK